jgi:hypothetical protein
MKLCHLCKLESKNYEDILDFPFKLYESKWALKIDLEEKYKNNRNYLLSINTKFNSNIIHEIIYYLIKNKYHNKLYRRQYVWALEILSEEPEINVLCNHKNCNNETPLECYVRCCEDKIVKSYEYIKDILTKHTSVSIELHETEKTIINPLVRDYAEQYHYFQKKLFAYLEEHYSHLISKCEKCNEIIDMFEDLEKIGEHLRNDPRKTLIALNINHIIILRSASISLCEKDKVNERHEYILKYFYKILNDMSIFF